MRERFPFAASVEGLRTQAGLLFPENGSLAFEYRFHATRRWRFDACIPRLKIAMEYHGGLFMARKGGHQTVKGTRQDWEKLNEAQILGWIVLQFGPDEVRTGTAMEVLERAAKSRSEK